MKKIITFAVTTLLAGFAFAQAPAAQMAQPVAPAVVGRMITEPAPVPHKVAAKKHKAPKKATAKKNKKGAKKAVGTSSAHKGAKVKAAKKAHKVH